MAEVNEKKEQIIAEASQGKEPAENLAEQAVASPKEVKEKNQGSKSGFWFGIFILLLVLAMAGGGFFLLQQLRDQQEDIGGDVDKGDERVIELTKQITGYQSQLSAIQSQLANLETEITGRDKFYNEKLADFSKLHQGKLDNTDEKLTTAMTLVQRQLGKTRGDWLLADAEYLLSIANQRLLLVGDLNTTIEALTAADQRLRESGDAAAFKVREQIAKEIAELRKVELPDIVGIYSSLQRLIDNADKLATLLPYKGKEVTQTEHKQEVQKEAHDHDLLDSALIELEGLVTIRHTEHPIAEILTVEQAKFLKEELKIKLEMVKLALVQQNDVLFKKSIEDAKKWLTEHFINNKDSDSFVKELDKLNSVKVKGEFPDVSKSLNLLRNIVKLRVETDKTINDSEPDISPITDNKPESEDPPNEPEQGQAPASEEQQPETQE